MSRQPFPSHADPCGWNAMLPPRTPRPAASGAISAKYAVVGAGYTGLAAARRLAERDPGAEIVVLEATTIGEGASGRNSGFASPHDGPGEDSPAGRARYAARNRESAAGFEALRGLIEARGIDCGLVRSGRIIGAATAHGEAALRASAALLGAYGLPHALLGRDAVAARIGSRYYGAGLYTEEGYLLQPAALVRGLADALPAGIALYENTPVLALANAGGWRLRTPEADITAGTVILATNAAVKHFGFLKDRIVTIHTYAAVTEALAPKDQGQLGTMAAWGLLPAHRLGTTVRRIGADRLMVRSLYAYERELPAAEVRAALLARFRARYPELGHVGLEYCWGGTTALTMNGAPAWGKLADGLYASAGCNGSGIVKGTALGLRLAELATTGGGTEAVRDAYGEANWIAPEPFRTIGFHVVSALERRRAGLES